MIAFGRSAGGWPEPDAPVAHWLRDTITPAEAKHYPQGGRMDLRSRIVRVYPCAMHGPDVVCAVIAAADRATQLPSTRGKRDVGYGKLLRAA